MVQLKIISLNCKSLYACWGNKNNIINVILKNPADIICLQETNYRLTEQITEKLNETSTGTGYKFKYFENNSIITHLTITTCECSVIKLERVYPDRCYIATGLLLENGFKFDVMVTHLDHLSEHTRLEQLDKIIPCLKDIDILVGDFNSIRFNDYTKKELETIQLIRQRGKVEIGQNDVITKIESMDFETTPIVGNTCPYGTRIDYIYAKKEFLKNCANVTHGIVDCITPNITDHNMVWTCFDITEK